MTKRDSLLIVVEVGNLSESLKKLFFVRFAVMYKIIRFYYNREGYKRTIKKGLTLEEAQAHCSDPETSSSTCKRPENLRRTKLQGAWFDGYTET